MLLFSEPQSWKKNPYPVGFVGIKVIGDIRSFPDNTGELRTDTVNNYSIGELWWTGGQVDFRIARERRHALAD